MLLNTPGSVGESIEKPPALVTPGSHGVHDGAAILATLSGYHPKEKLKRNNDEEGEHTPSSRIPVPDRRGDQDLAALAKRILKLLRRQGPPSSKNWKGIVGKKFSRVDFAKYVDGIALKGWHPKFVVVHNTQEPTLAKWGSVTGESRMRGLEHYYRDDQKWSAGPHLFVANDGIWAFTPLTTPGVHAPSWNREAWGVEIVGDYSQEKFEGEVKQNAISALAALHNKINKSANTLRLHKEDPKTTHKGCPGSNIVKAELIASVTAAMKKGS